MSAPSTALPVERESRTADFAAVTAVVLWGIGPVLVKHVDLPAASIVLYRLFFGALCFSALLRMRGGHLTRNVLRLSLPGGIAFATNIVFFFEAVKLTTVTDAAIIAALQPVLLLFVVGRLFGERVALRDIILGAVSIGGVVLVVAGTSGGGHQRVLGDVLAVGALLTWAWYFVASKTARQQLGALEYQAALLVIGAIVVVPFVVFSGHVVRPNASAAAWLVVITFGPGGGHLLMNWAHAHIRLTVASLLTLASPAISVLAAAAVLHERVILSQYLGVAVVLGALGMIVVQRSDTADDHPADDVAVEPPASA